MERMIKIRICKQCGKEKILDEFYTQKKIKKDGTKYIYYNPRCKECCISNAEKRINENYEQHLESVAKYSSKPETRNKIYLSNKKRLEENKYSDWQRNNKDKIKGYNLNRTMNKTHDISKDEWEDCKNYFNYRCAYCELKIEEHYNLFRGEMKWTDFHKEHVDHNGSNDLSNCVPACKSCNSEKHTSHLEDWYNEDNEKFTEKRLNKILKWLNKDYKVYIKKK